MTARLDDLTPGGSVTWVFEDPVDTLTAFDPDVVPQVLDEAEGRAASGLWAVGFVAYEAAPAFDAALAVRSRQAGEPMAELPLAWFRLYRTRRPAQPLTYSPSSNYTLSNWTATIDRTSYHHNIGRVRDYIAAGDTYQTNYSFRLRAAFAGQPAALYRDVALAQAGAFNAYIDTGRYVIASASPELFFNREGDRLVTRPMKGTARRGRWAGEDQATADALADSEKDRAENLMIVDLLRNDMGRVSEFGTVTVDRLFEVERYATVWQLTSTISSRLAAGTAASDIFTALFPCGSVTGAPKVRTMEIIADMEHSPRGVYCGAVGYLSPDRRATFNVGIRTIAVDLDEGIAEYGVGGGITWSSNPAGEYDEAWAKALVLATPRPPVGLIESLRFEPATGLAWEKAHLDRMASSAAYLALPFDRAAAASALKQAAAGATEVSKVRLEMSPDGGFTVDTEPLAAAEGPARVVIDDTAVDSRDVRLYHKTTDRRVYTDRLQRHPEADDVLLVNERGELTESATANLAVELAGMWWTPPLESGCLPGVYRQVLLDEGEIAERVLTPDDLERAAGIALVNAVRLWRPAAVMD